METTMRYQVTNLRCEYLKEPLTIDSLQPRLSWEGLSSREGSAQSAFRILASRSKESLQNNNGDLWDSGKVESNLSLHIAYNGHPLTSHQQVFWKVMAWDEQGRAGCWSKPASWTMGILHPEEWKAVYISHYLGNSHSSPLFRKDFSVKNSPRRVLLYASALGLYHLTLNGRAVGDELFAPGWTDYKKRRYYRCYNVTRLIRKGRANCLGAVLGSGWYKGTLGWNGQSCYYGNRTALIAQMHIEYENGTTETLTSDPSWKSSFGPVRQSGIYEGETADAQLEERGWNLPGFNDQRWTSAIEIAPASGVGPKDRPIPLQGYPSEPVRRTEELAPIAMWTIQPGKIIYDLGQNIAGIVRISIKGRAGAVIRLRFGEMVNSDQTLYTDNLRSAIATDTYVMKGRKKEVWEPKFTFHGFRYVEVSGNPNPARLSDITGIVIGSDTRRVGNFTCSNAMVNQLYSNAVWTQRANFLEVPTDCPQRDERLGWTGDAQVFIRTAIFNMDVAAFFTKWMNDLIDAQSEDGAFPNVAPNVTANSPIGKGDAAWGDAGVVCPWALYECYEDRELLKKMYTPMKAWITYLENTSRGLLRGPEFTHCFGDWLSIEANTPLNVVQTAHFAWAVDITRKAAEVLGKESEARHYRRLFTRIRTAFNKAFVKADGTISGETQTAYLMALKFNLLDETTAKQATKHLLADIRQKKFHSSTGFIGTGLILDVLRDTGHLDCAYRLLENTTFPSWGYSVVNGATTIWERWNGWTKEGGPGDVNMNSYSHYAYGAVVEWMFNTVAGISHQGHGFQHFTLRPQPGGSLTHATGSYHSPYGLISSAWRKLGKVTLYEITIPANTKATVLLPVKNLTGVKLNGRSVLDQKSLSLSGQTGFILPAGIYSIVF